MKKNFTKRLSIYMLAAFLVTISAVFVLQTVHIEKIRNMQLLMSQQNIQSAGTMPEMPLRNPYAVMKRPGIRRGHTMSSAMLKIRIHTDLVKFMTLSRM